MRDYFPGAIAIANYDFRSSGTVAKSIQIGRAAHAAGLPVELWAVRAAGPLLDRVPPGLPVVVMESSRARLPSRPLDLACAIPALARTIRERRPAVLLSGGNHFHLAARASLALSGMRDSVRLGLRVSNSSRHGPGVAQVAAAGPVTRLKYGDADFLAAVSIELAEEVRTQVPQLQVECIPNGCDLAAVRRAMRADVQHPFLAGGGVVIATMGRIARQKGFDVLIRALAILRREVDARLVIIGSGPAAGVAALRRLAHQLGVAAHVDFTGYMANPFPLIACSHLYVCASRWEGSCNALLEALACDVPVVATSCPTGNAEILLGGMLGELAPPDSPAALAAAMGRELRARRDVTERHAQVARLDIARCMEGWCALLRREHQLASLGAVAPGMAA